jgi:hypothetical protein
MKGDDTNKQYRHVSFGHAPLLVNSTEMARAGCNMCSCIRLRSHAEHFIRTPKPLAYIIQLLSLLSLHQASTKPPPNIQRVYQAFLGAYYNLANMVAFSHLALALSAVVGSFAAPIADADAPDFELSSENSLMARQNYNQNYKTSGNVNFSPTNNGYSVQFSNAGDFVVGKGWTTGTTRYGPFCIPMTR